MSAWFDTGNDGIPEAAWETYHDNAKRGRRLGALGGGHAPLPESSPPSGQTFALQAGGSLVMLPGEGTVDAVYAGGGTMALASLAALLAVAARPVGDRDPTEVWLYANAVETLPAGLYRHAHDARTLEARGRETLGGRLALAAGDPELVARSEAVVLLVGRLEAATRADGERGYRNALLAAGRHAAAFDLAAGPSGLWCRDIAGFYDREIDGLLSLDGLSESVLSIMAIGTTAYD